MPAEMELKENLPEGVKKEPSLLNFQVLSYPRSLSQVEKWGKITAWSNDTSQSGVIFQSIQNPEQWAIPDPNVSASTLAKQLSIPSTQTPLPLSFSDKKEFPFDHYPQDQIGIVDEKTAFILLTRLDFILMQAHEVGHTIEMKPEYLGAWPPMFEESWAFQKEKSLEAYQRLVQNSFPKNYPSPQGFFEIFHRQW